MEVEPFAEKLLAYFRSGERTDLAAGQVGDLYDLGAGTYRNVLWQSDGSGRGDGWTLTYRPTPPTLPVPLLTTIAKGMTGFIVKPTYHMYADRDSNPHVTEATIADSPYYAARDYVKPDALCTPSLMTCPVLNLWAHFNYTVPDPAARPAFGSCIQQTYDGRNYFVFEKLKCGAERVFDDDRGTMMDKITIFPEPDEILAYLAQASTTKDPNDGTGGMQFITEEDYEPVSLPPELDCSCEMSIGGNVVMDIGGGTLLKSDEPGPPVYSPQLDTMGLNLINATMRMYADPTFSWEVTERGR